MPKTAENKKPIKEGTNMDNAVRVSPDQVSVATSADLPALEKFLLRPDIDSLFTPPLSDPARGMTIEDRVAKKHEGNHGSLGWLIVKVDDEIVGCMAIVTTDMPTSFEKDENKKVDEGVSVDAWEGKDIYEISTVAASQKTKNGDTIKGIGAALLTKASETITNQDNAVLSTDSWVGGDMGGFTQHVVNKYSGFAKPTELADQELDILIRMFSDPSKRGEDGPPTVIYVVPTREEDWQMLAELQPEIAELREKYHQIAETFH